MFQIALLGASLGVSAIQGVLGAGEASKQRKLAREQQRVQVASEQVAANQQRRQEFRRERVRRAQMEQAAQATGTVGSSGLLGAQSALGSLIGGTQAQTRFGELSSNLISANQQAAANSQFRSQMINAVGGLVQGGLSAAGSFGGGGSKPDVFDLGGTDPFAASDWSDPFRSTLG